MHEKISDRIRMFRESTGLTQSVFASKYGVPKGSYQKYEMGLNVPGADAIEKLVAAGLNANWLLTGQGPMLVKKGYAAAQEVPEYRSTTDSVELGYVSIPFFDGVRVSAGPGALVESELASKAIRFNEIWLRNELGVNPANLGLAMVEGDSMEPTFRSGGLVLFDRSVDRLCREGLYIIRSGDMVMLKRVRALLTGGIEIISDNQAYERWTLTPEDLETANFSVLGRVVWGDRRF